MPTAHGLDFAADFANSASPTTASFLPAAIIIPHSSAIDLPDELVQNDFSTGSVMTLMSVPSLIGAANPSQGAVTTSQAPFTGGSNGLLLDSGSPSATGHVTNSTNQTATLTISNLPTSTAVNQTTSSSTFLPKNGANQPASFAGVAMVAAVLALI
ncbi:hypothetical protein B9G98_01111 [Wickerhamiella sorbophila]|uniref:Uncharacterized protein n=1 Tax=Wickerhamiella sorbophila TaxID=45607 RepID=A0A2T0FES4_9ASCO|nr:hypothetical protein B9G98_01111 [Wickerhamiella sorbophila]PRT53491.1 hypothetical protein B9G98_01111 [Wickerhamiella sorbophila]